MLRLPDRITLGDVPLNTIDIVAETLTAGIDAKRASGIAQDAYDLAASVGADTTVPKVPTSVTASAVAKVTVGEAPKSIFSIAWVNPTLNTDESALTDLRGVIVEYDDGSGFKQAGIFTSTSFTFESYATHVDFRLWAVDNTGNTSSVATADTNAASYGTPTTPAVPTLTALAVGGAVNAAWTGVADAALFGYEIEVSVSTESYPTAAANWTVWLTFRVPSAPSAAGLYQFSPNASGKWFKARVRAVWYGETAGSWSDYSTAVALDARPILTPEVPSNVSAIGLMKSVMLDWSPAATAFGEWEVYRDTSSGFTPDTSGYTNRIYRGVSCVVTDDVPVLGTTYYYKVCGVNWQNTRSSFSASVSATTGTVGSTEIADLAVTTAKIDALAVTTAKIADLNVTTAKIAALAVTSAKINDVSADKITTGTLSANQAITVAGSANNPRVIIDTTGVHGYNGTGGATTAFDLTTAGLTLNGGNVNLNAGGYLQLIGVAGADGTDANQAASSMRLDSYGLRAYLAAGKMAARFWYEGLQINDDAGTEQVKVGWLDANGVGGANRYGIRVTGAQNLITGAVIVGSTIKTSDSNQRVELGTTALTAYDATPTAKVKVGMLTAGSNTRWYFTADNATRNTKTGHDLSKTAPSGTTNTDNISTGIRSDAATTYDVLYKIDKVASGGSTTSVLGETALGSLTQNSTATFDVSTAITLPTTSANDCYMVSILFKVSGTLKATHVFLTTPVSTALHTANGTVRCRCKVSALINYLDGSQPQNVHVDIENDSYFLDFGDPLTYGVSTDLLTATGASALADVSVSGVLTAAGATNRVLGADFVIPILGVSSNASLTTAGAWSTTSTTAGGVTMANMRFAKPAGVRYLFVDVNASGTYGRARLVTNNYNTSSEYASAGTKMWRFDMGDATNDGAAFYVTYVAWNSSAGTCNCTPQKFVFTNKSDLFTADYTKTI